MPTLAEPDGLQLPSFERILCAVDLAQPTPNALSLASVVAAGFGAALEALYVGASASSLDPATVQELDQVVQGSGARGTTTRLAFGAPAPAILERAREHRADLIVLGSRQRSDLGWQFRDDVVRDVSALADCATLTVHERDVPAVIERILVPVDFGPATGQMVDFACAFAKRFGAKVQLLHVVSRGQGEVGSGGQADLAALERRMVELGVDGAAQVIVAGGVANGIESYNERSEFDLVVLGRHVEPEPPPRLVRGVIATLRNRMSVPLLSVRAPRHDATWPRARAQGHAARGVRTALSA
ncbi:MAG TPA: universal stress protein [Polyangiaceae bacterium]|nr:universal stress protein [Polyangiaceae bacterium]